MITNNNVESERQSLQFILDSQKERIERNILGQFSTPKPLADSMVNAALKYVKRDIRFLDTSIGTGVFFSSLLDCLGENNISYACGYEIDDYYAFPSMKLWQKREINYVVGDFLGVIPPKKNEEKYNLIISNPPYVRHHYISNRHKKALNESVNLFLGLSFSGLTGLYGYFMALSSLWLQNDGISVWLVPSEFLDVNYGREIKFFLLKKVKLLRIHRFSPLKTQFVGALVSSSVVFYSTGQTTDSILFTTGNDINNPETQKFILPDSINHDDKWSNYFSSSLKTSSSEPTIGDYFSVKRGIVTGSNKHFILTNDSIEKYKIPNEYLRPILPSPRYIANNIIEKDADGLIAGIKNRYLLNVTCSEHEIKNLPNALVFYLYEIYNEIKDNYIIRNRTPWFKQEHRPECPFLLSYMGRNPNEPFRLFLNNTNAVVPNVYLMLYPKFNWKDVETQKIGFLKSLHNKLQNINSESFVSSGRVYGGGLYKLEPKELMRVPIGGVLSEDILNILEKARGVTQQLSLFE